MEYAEWERNVPKSITGDPLWQMQSYRLALYVADVGWDDVSRLNRDRRTMSLSDQLYRALGSIGANLAEGYSRGSGRDQARFYEYALGSARESRHWYYGAHHVLGDEHTSKRISLLTRLIQLLLATIQQGRTHNLREEPETYRVEVESVITQHLIQTMEKSEVYSTAD